MKVNNDSCFLMEKSGWGESNMEGICI